ncbi:adhesion G protein-coupled receptor F5-like [Perca fluviatilis]|uniref:adhesion G protein-coupled receptor F5-like n=1 Tax=Perca fluviatilis TaxID=8168 RepID=UPI0019667F0C|nr:adhesion G protein-coupled receptor F5-like [Perca fluviatilis]
MALLKAVRYLVVLLVIYYSMEDHRYRESLNLFFEELMGTKASDIHAREKRQAPLSSTDYVLKIVINTTDPTLVEKVLSELPSGINLINNTSVITSINIITVCSPNMSAYQCRCVENYAWSYNTCIALNACDAIIDNTCGCINSLPPDGQYCELNTSQTDPVDFDLVLDLRVPVSNVPSNFIDIFRQKLTALTLPLLTGSLNIIDITFTTGCYPNSTGGLQCECENQFAWPCDKCNSYGACSNASSQTCECINGLPDGEFCEPITNVTQCPTSTVTPTTPNTTIQNMTTSNTTQATPTTSMITTPITANTTKPTATSTTQKIPTSNTTTAVSNFFTMAIPFEDSYNNENSSIYQDSINAIKTQSANYIPNIKQIKLQFRSGSTIGDYTITASSVPATVIDSVNIGILIELANKYSMVYTSQNVLKFDPLQVFLGGSVTITCGPPPANLNLSSGWTAEWTHNGTGIPGDNLHVLAQQNGTATLSVSKADFTDSGDYVCTLKSNNIAFIQTGTFNVQQKPVILQQLQQLLEQSQSLNSNSLPGFLQQLSDTTTNLSQAVVTSPANINATVEILKNIAKLNIPINETLMTDILLVAGVLTTDAAKGSWNSLNNKSAQNISVTSNSPPAKSVSSDLLQSLETITTVLTNDSFNIETPSIMLNKTILTDNFSADFPFSNSSVGVIIPVANGGHRSIAVLSFASMDTHPPRLYTNIKNQCVNNVSFTFAVKNDTLVNPKCVFWNFSLFNNIGGWDNKGCELVRNINKTVTCNCNHLTSFSILMSPYSHNSLVLDYITYVGVSISMASLVICLIIEAVIWKKIRRNNTSYLRHVSIVNIAVSLLIADIWFIIGAAISDDDEINQPACNAATFFIHFFYLALFFWMLASGLLLLYRTVNVFDGGLSKTSLLAFGFTLGYGAPLIIVIITVAVTAPKKEYIQETGVCWLNWYQSNALLAFVIPALVIVVINLVILLVVIFKMLRRRSMGDAVQAGERHVLVVIARTLAFLTPFFGLTWGLGVGTMTNPDDEGILIAFTFFNSLQGFFILVFGTLLDKKVRSEITIRSQNSRTGTRSTSAGISSTWEFFRNWRRGRDGYNVSSAASGGAHSAVNI